MKTWNTDRFHFFFAALAMIWVLVAAATLQAYREVVVENSKLRSMCQVKP
jgi:hypothetical protein